MPVFKMLFKKLILPLLLVAFALFVAGCETEDPPVNTSSAAVSVPEESTPTISHEESTEESSAEPSDEPSRETSSEDSRPPEKTGFDLHTLSGKDLPGASDVEATLINKTTDPTLDAFLRSYSGSFPAVGDMVYTEDGLRVCVIYSSVPFYGSYQAKCLWYRFDPATGELKDPASKRPEAFVYDKNAYNKNGYFWVDYETILSGTACPYVVLYNENGVNRTLCFEETALEYVRIIRQTDTHVVLSVLRSGERYYRILDREGRVIAQLEWISDVSSITPLMFDSNYLYCKKDADEDFVYDTIGAIDLSTGKYQDLLTVGNSDYWTYFADGKGIAIYDNVEQPDSILYFATGTQTLMSYPAKRRVNYLDTFYGTLYGMLQGEEDSHVFLWNNDTLTLFESEEAYSNDCRIVMGIHGVAVLDNGVLAVYVQSN